MAISKSTIKHGLKLNGSAGNDGYNKTCIKKMYWN